VVSPPIVVGKFSDATVAVPLLVKFNPRFKAAGAPVGPSVAVITSVGGIKLDVFALDTVNPSLVSTIVFDSKNGALTNGTTIGREIAWYTAVKFELFSVLLVLLNVPVLSFVGMLHEFITPAALAPVVAIVSVKEAPSVELLFVSTGVPNTGFWMFSTAVFDVADNPPVVATNLTNPVHEDPGVTV